MGFELCAEFAIKDDVNEKAIDLIVDGAGELKRSSWTARAEILTTGTAWEKDPFRKGTGDSFAKLVKNGRKEDRKQNLSAIKGYPGTVAYSEGPEFSSFKEATRPRPDLLHSLPAGSLLLQATLTLQTPFFSKDDRPFYPNDNSLKRDKVFQVPCLAAAGVKGLLRWAWCMVHPNESTELERLAFGPRLSDCKDDQGGSQGCVMFYPLFWQGSVGLEMINPVNRQSGAGSDPIKFEVVKPGAKATLSLLIVNRWNKPDHGPMVARVLESLDWLLANSGLSAKRTADWGQVTASDWKAWCSGTEASAAESDASSAPAPLPFLDEEGRVKPINDPVFTTDTLNEWSGWNSKSQVKKNRQGAYDAIVTKYSAKEETSQQEASQPAMPMQEFAAPTLCALMSKLPEEFRLQGGPHA